MRPISRSGRRASPNPARSIFLAIAVTGLLVWSMPGPASATPGRVSEFVLTPQSAPSGIAIGSDGTIWFTEWGRDAIGHLVPGTGLTEFTIPTSDAGLA